MKYWLAFYYLTQIIRTFVPSIIHIIQERRDSKKDEVRSDSQFNMTESNLLPPIHP